jgi:superfamily II DNA or RNA helicase
MIIERGVNAKQIEVMFMAQGGKSKKRIKQLIGRALRQNDKSDEVLVYEFYDDAKRVGLHSRLRKKIYQEEGFEVITEYRELRNKPVGYN